MKRSAISSHPGDALVPPDAVEIEMAGLPPIRLATADGMSADFAQVVETLYQDMDAVQEFRRLSEQLEIGDDRADYGSVNKHLDRAETNARKSHKLFLKAQLEEKRFTCVQDVINSRLRDEAYRTLQSEKDNGDRKKAITNEDVSSRMSFLFPDETKHQAENALKIRGMVEHCQTLVDLWKSRCRSLTTMLTQIRK